MLFLSTGNFKILVTAGLLQNGSPTFGSEIIDLESSASVTCPAVPNFPIGAIGSTGALIQGKIPLVCSGYSNTRNCYLLRNNAWEQTGSLNVDRYISMILPNSPFQNPTHKAIIFGGLSTDTMEVFNGTSWSKMELRLPVVISSSCAVYTNPTTIFIVSGNHAGILYSQDTYYFNSLEQKWVSGPKVIKGRLYHSCGRIKRNQNGDQLSTLIVAGFDISVALDSVEILDDDSGTWRSGPKLPVALGAASMFQDPRGGLIVIGGSSPNPGTLYRLRHAGWNAQWETLVQKSQLMLKNAVAIPIPDEIAIC